MNNFCSRVEIAPNVAPPSLSHDRRKTKTEQKYNVGLKDAYFYSIATYLRGEEIAFHTRPHCVAGLFCREYLSIFKKTVAMHEIFLCRLASHPVLKSNHNFRVFLEYDKEVSNLKFC